MTEKELAVIRAWLPFAPDDTVIDPDSYRQWVYKQIQSLLAHIDAQDAEIERLKAALRRETEHVLEAYRHDYHD